MEFSPVGAGLLGAEPAGLAAIAAGDFAVIGAPYGSPYGMSGVHSDAANAPDVFRARTNRRFGTHLDRYDFSLGGTLLGDTGAGFWDLGNLTGDPRQLVETAAAVTAATAAVVARGGMPIVLGGDDSVPILVAAGFASEQPRINVLQIDAHIDFADEAHGRTDGFSSTMRRISEMPWVGQVVQIGARGTGSARPADVAAARAAGSVLLPMTEVRRAGLDAALTVMRDDLPWFVTLDVDGLDPTIAPGTSCPVPGGLSFSEAEQILATVSRLGCAGIDIVEHFPSLDIGDTTSLTLSRLLATVIGTTARLRSHA